MNRSTVLALIGIGIVATFTTIWLAGGDDGKVRPALAGPCGADPVLVLQRNPNTPLDSLMLFGVVPGKTYTDDFRVETLPDVLPPGKPPVTIVVIDIDGHSGIEIAFLPDSSNGSFDTIAGVKIRPNVPPGFYDYDLEITCHEQVTTIPFGIYVSSCPAPVAGFRAASSNGTETAEPFPSSCAIPTPSPTPGSPTPTGSATPTETPIATPTITPTPAPFPWGDLDCSGDVSPVDSLGELRWEVHLPVNQHQPCWIIGNVRPQFSGGAAAPPFGDVDCSGSVNSVDALKILRHVVQLPVQQNDPCPLIGESPG